MSEISFIIASNLWDCWYLLWRQTSLKHQGGGFRVLNFNPACSTISGIEAMYMIRKGQAGTSNVHEEIDLINRILRRLKISGKGIGLCFLGF